MNKKIDYWIDSFEKFHGQYIIMPAESSNFFVPGESIFITVMKPPGFMLLYKISSEIPFKDQKIHVKKSDYDLTNWAISDYLSHYLGLKTIEPLTCLSCNQSNPLKIL